MIFCGRMARICMRFYWLRALRQFQANSSQKFGRNYKHKKQNAFWRVDLWPLSPTNWWQSIAYHLSIIPMLYVYIIQSDLPTFLRTLKSYYKVGSRWSNLNHSIRYLINCWSFIISRAIQLLLQSSLTSFYS